jgi:phage gpG-like protein
VAHFDVAALNARLEEMAAKSDDAARGASEAMAAVAETRAKQMLGMSSHTRGSKTPAPPGQPPSLISGALRRSVRRTMLLPRGNCRWESHVGGTIVYARIQELGGWAGKNHRSHLPPRPYLRPAVILSQDAIRKAAIAVFRRILWS